MNIDDKQRLDRLIGAWLLVVLRPVARLGGRVLRRDHGGDPRGEIVIVKLLGGGSLLIALPALLGLRRRFPDRRITLVCGSAVAPFGEPLGIFDAIERVDDGAGFAKLAFSAARTLFRLVRRRVDTVVDLEVYSQLSTVFTLLTLARNRVGFYVESTYWRRNVLTHLVFFNRARGVFHFYGVMVRLLGAQPATREDVRAHLLARVADGGPATDAIAIGAGCSDLSAARQLPLDQWRAFAEAHQTELSGRQIVFLGAASDRARSEEIASAFTQVLGSTFCYENLCGRLTLRESLARLARTQRFLGIDSALIHAARALGVPSHSFFGPTDPANLLESIPGYQETVHYRPPICSPCLHVAQTPPCKGENVCMQLFTRTSAARAYWCEDASGRTVQPRERRERREP